MTSPGKRGQMADVNGHASFSGLTGLLQDLGPCVRSSVNSKDMGKPNWQCRKIVCVWIFFHSLDPKVSHSTKIKYLERPYKSGSQLWRFTHFLVRLPVHIGFLSVFQTFSRPVNSSLSQEFCSCLPLSGVLCHCPSGTSLFLSS